MHSSHEGSLHYPQYVGTSLSCKASRAARLRLAAHSMRESGNCSNCSRTVNGADTRTLAARVRRKAPRHPSTWRYLVISTRFTW